MLFVLLGFNLPVWLFVALVALARPVDPFAGLILLLLTLPVQWLATALSVRLHVWLATPAGVRVVALVSTQRLLQTAVRLIVTPRPALPAMTARPPRRRAPRRLPFLLFGFAPLLTAP